MLDNVGTERSRGKASRVERPTVRFTSSRAKSCRLATRTWAWLKVPYATILSAQMLASHFRSGLPEPSPPRNTIILIKRSEKRWFNYHDDILAMSSRVESSLLAAWDDPHRVIVL